MVEEVRDIIEEANVKFGEGVRANDAAMMAELYTEDTVLMPPNGEIMRGKKRTEEFWAASMSMGVKDCRNEIVELVGSGDMVNEVGTYTIRVQPEGMEPFEERGKYLVVWKRTADGSWKKHWDIWNSSMQPQE